MYVPEMRGFGTASRPSMDGKILSQDESVGQRALHVRFGSWGKRLVRWAEVESYGVLVGARRGASNPDTA